MLLKVLFVLLPFAVAFQTAPPLRFLVGGRPALFPRQTPILWGTSGDQDTWKAQRQKAKDVLEQMDTLESSIRDGGSSLSVLQEQVSQVEQAVSNLTAQLLPPSGVSLADYESSIRSYLQMPLSMRLALCDVLEMPEAAQDWTESPEIVTKLYEKRRQLTAQRLQDAQKKIARRMEGSADLEQEVEQILEELLDGNSVDQFQRDAYANQLLPRVSRKEGKSATSQQLQVLMNVLDKTTFVPNGQPETIPGGYVIRGRNTRSTGDELIQVLDKKLPAQWDAQVSLFPELAVDEESGMAGDENVLLLLNNDFAPTTSRVLLSFSTAAACATTFLFAVGCFGANSNVAQHMQDLTAVGDYSGVNWFNGMLAQLLLPLGFIQAMHEAGHLLVAWRDKMKTSPPTLLPFWILPYLGAKTDLKTSPKDLTSLFDFAFLGPFLGLLTSAIVLFTGLQSTLLADSSMSLYFPSIPVSLLQISTLGGSIVDFAFGGQGIVTSQDAATTIPLHPWAIAGYAGLLLNSFELLPLGSTDGGRISQALFGRSTQSIIGGATWISLLVGSLFGAGQQQDVLLGVWAVYNIVQNDMEVPCRNEVDPVNVPRSLAGFALWFVAILAITPMEVASNAASTGSTMMSM